MLAYRAYRRTHAAWAGFEAIHGVYDGLQTGLYRHDHLQLLVPLAGRVQLEWAKEAAWVGPERAVLLPAGLAHAASALGPPFEFLAINAPAGWLPGLAAAVGAPPPGPGLALVAEPGAWLQARQLAAALDDPRPGQARFLAAGTEQLGLYALAASAPAVAAPGEVERAVAAIRARHAEPLSVAGLAAELAITPRHLERRFQAVLGTSPRQFLIAVRLAAARDLLAATALPIEAIATSVGFGDPSHFARSFRQAAGVTPGAYRLARRTDPTP